jgi:hypothetical protein
MSRRYNSKRRGDIRSLSGPSRIQDVPIRVQYSERTTPARLNVNTDKAID